MATRPKQTLSPEAIARRLLDALRSCGGTMKRNELRIAVARWLRVAEFDAIADEMIKGRLIQAERVTIDRVTVHGRAIRHTAIVYQLVDRKPRG